MRRAFRTVSRAPAASACARACAGASGMHRTHHAVPTRPHTVPCSQVYTGYYQSCMELSDHSSSIFISSSSFACCSSSSSSCSDSPSSSSGGCAKIGRKLGLPVARICCAGCLGERVLWPEPQGRRLKTRILCLNAAWGALLCLVSAWSLLGLCLARCGRCGRPPAVCSRLLAPCGWGWVTPPRLGLWVAR